MHKKLKLLVVALLVTSPFSANAVPIAEGDDSYWTASGEVTFEIVHVSGALAAGGDLAFGAFLAGDPSETGTIFFPGYAVGDTFTCTGCLDDLVFGFFLANIDTAFGGPYTFYSDSSLNPDGLDAFAAEWVGDAWLLEFEDLFLPLIPGGGDLRVLATGIRPVPEPGALALLGIGLLGVGLARRRAKA